MSDRALNTPLCWLSVKTFPLRKERLVKIINKNTKMRHERHLHLCCSLRYWHSDNIFAANKDEVKLSTTELNGINVNSTVSDSSTKPECEAPLSSKASLT